MQIKRASEDRELENKEFQQTVADQRATQGILKKALDRLKVVYGFVQTSQPDQLPQPRFWWIRKQKSVNRQG